ncbi:hypothetical protein [Nocardia brasiliensis]|uniref:hypothetical protein n=1 Tax=Nocardia brasiliensis TaxID=37326 RepID=UPI0018935390|nr:hypothetical protein [Nocardia brasiliensis]MBF6125542.1 hypothetical protein [Nocardia brasiliensis]
MSARAERRRAGAVPTQVQAGLLRQLQNATAQLAATGATAWGKRQMLGDLTQTVRLLDEQARELAVPDRWIEFVTEQGRAGVFWNARQQLPTGRAEAREQQLDRLHAEVDHLYEMAALQAAYRDHVGGLTSTKHGRFEELQQLQWRRIVMVARGLNITTVEIAHRWSADSQRWAGLLNTMRALPVAQLTRRWHDYTTATALGNARMRFHALQLVGLDPTGTPAPPTPEQLTRTAEKLWHELDSQPPHAATAADGSEPGIQIADAITAATATDTDGTALDDTTAETADAPAGARVEIEAEP